MTRFVSLLLAACVGLPALAAEAEPFAIRSGPTQTALIELFTSEGCSSCPPAERWLAGFENRPELWRSVVPVVWHVDYWDNLGWPDRFAFRMNTRRQERYAAAWQSQSVYTPGFVRNGVEWRDWNRPMDFDTAARPSTGVLELTSTNRASFSVGFTPHVKSSGPFDVTVAWLGSGLESDVRRGENAGRKLRHSFVVLRTSTQRLLSGDGRFAATVSVPFPDERDSKRLAVAAWISRASEQAPIQAVGGWWSRP